MTAENTIFDDLLAAQMEMPKLQKSAINPHFKNRYVPLEELVEAVLPILNKHNLILLQYPTIAGSEPALTYELRHRSGEMIGGTMLLQAQKDDDPQAQGSAITYARRYSLMSLLGLTADADDDAENTRTARVAGASAPSPRPPANGRQTQQPDGPMPQCPQHGPTMRFWPAEMSKAGKPVGSRYKCSQQGCRDAKGYPETVWASDWESHISQQQAVAVNGHDYNDLPHEE